MRKMTRREMLRLMGYGSAGLAMGSLMPGCGAKEGPAATSVAEQVKLRIVTRPNIITIIGAGDVARVYNDDTAANPKGVKALVEEQIEGFQAKAMELHRRNELPWDGYIWNNMWIYGYQHIQTGVIQPLDEYIAKSTVPWAKDVAKPGFYVTDTLWPACQRDGKQYAIPCLPYASVLAYYTEMLNDVGYEKPPETWDEFTAMLHKIKAKGGEGIVPMAFSPGWHRTPGAVFATFTDKPYDDSPEHLTNINSPAGWEAMEMMRGWFKDGLCSVEQVTATDPISQYWERQRSAVAIEASRWVRSGQNIHGVWKCQGANLPVPNKGDPPRTYYLVDGSCVFSGTKYAQEMVDFFLTIHGPEGASADKWWNNQLANEGAPIHEPTFDRLVPAKHHNYWVKDIYKALRNSTPAPLTGSQTIMLYHFRPILDKILWGEVSVKQGCAEAADGLRTIIEKFKGDVREGTWKP